MMSFGLQNMNQKRRFLSQAYRCLSSNSDGNQFATQRTSYKKQLRDLRRVWREDYEKIVKQQLEKKEAEQKKLVLEKAVRVREKRKLSVLRQEKARKAREVARRLYLEKLARNHLILEEKQKKQQEQYRLAVEDLEKEKQVWVTTENIHEKITPGLFADAGSTGLKTRFSDLWRYQVISNKHVMGKLMNPEKFPTESYEESYLTERVNHIANAKLTQRLMIEETLDALISTGEERANYKELVKRFMKSSEQLGFLKELKTAYQQDLEVDEEESRLLEAMESGDYDFESGEDESDAAADDYDDEMEYNDEFDENTLDDEFLDDEDEERI